MATRQMERTPTQEYERAPEWTGTNWNPWLIVCVIAIALLAGAALGVGIAALRTGTSGRQGHVGPQGAQGAQGVPGPRGLTGPAGPAGARGTVATGAVVSGTAVTSVSGPTVGSTITATATCSKGEVLLSGGAQVTGGASKNVALQSSYPVGGNSWQVVAVVVSTPPAGQTATVHPYALCGKT